MKAKSRWGAAAALSLTVSAGGCGERAEREVLGPLRESAKGIGESVAPYRDKAGAYAADQIGRLYKVEYTVRDLPGEVSAADLERTLRGLGEERWECSVHEREGRTRLACRRLPLSFLKLVPYMF